MPNLSSDQKLELGKIPANKTATLDLDSPAGMACWNWALYGGTEDAVDPASFFTALGKNTELAQAALASIPEPYRSQLQGLRSSWMASAQSRSDLEATVQKIVEWTVDFSPLERAVGPTGYTLCMHWPVADGVTYEHWWIETYGYTAECLTSWPYAKIYQPRSPDPAHYAQIRIEIDGLTDSQLSGIGLILGSKYYIATPSSGGWS